MAPSVSIAEVERELASLRTDATDLRTSVLTHVAWAPAEWREAARETLAGLEERHPSRTILLFPQRDADRDEIDADVSLRHFSLSGFDRDVSTEVIELRLLGSRVETVASAVAPLLLPDLPAFLRWRGVPDFGERHFDELLEIVDRLVVDSAEWPGAELATAYAALAQCFGRVVVSDIAWARTVEWRRALARGWPELPKTISGPPPEAALVAGWLRSRAGAHVAVTPAESLLFGGEEEPSELLSAELDRFSRDPLYEEAVACAFV